MLDLRRREFVEFLGGAAKMLGLAIPDSFLIRANEVIE
jgi:hypothetical protein